SAWTTPSKTIKTPAATPEITPGQTEITGEPADSSPVPAADSAPQADEPQISQTKDETGTE
ncbi:MAG TPA: hypothetical protein VN363_09005, partial [Anaerolineales bacterium]|nr:hypothetical protein [Anaerolineales bacterium]